MIYKYFYTRSFRISVLVMVLFSIICTRIPLLNYLGFEFSVFTVLISGLVCGLLTLSLWKLNLIQGKSGVWRFLIEIISVQIILFLIPFIISLTNALFIKNCSVGSGAIFYFLIVLPGILFSISLAMFIGAIFNKFRKTLYVTFYILLLLHIPIVTFFRPQIFAFNPIIGFFPGFTYDETLRVVQRLIVYRIATAAASGCILVFSELIFQIRFKRSELLERPSYFPHKIEIPVVAILIPIVFVVFSLSDKLGLSSSEDFIRGKLIGEYKTKHFDIIYPAGSITWEYAEQLGYLHEFYFKELTKDLNIDSHGTITSFIYDSPDQKGKLIGAANTNIAKPWLRQMHINMESVEYSLKHEMTHVLASEFGWSPLKIAKNSCLTEGLAVAMERTSMNEPLDRSAALALATGVNSNIESLFSSTGFFNANAWVSYTLAGSFCRFLIDSFGIEKFKQLYKTDQFDAIYHKNLKSLVADWQNSIRNITLSSGDSIKAAYIFKRLPIFGKECVRVIANLNADTKALIERHEFEKALLSAEKSLALSRTPEAVSQKVTALFELQRFQDAVKFIKERLADKTISYAILPLHLKLGDAYFAIDSLAEAKREYEIIENIRLSPWYEEACALRLEALKDIQARSELRNYFILPVNDTVRIGNLKLSRNTIAKFLLAREYFGKEQFVESARILESLGIMESKTLEFFRLNRLGRIFFRLQMYGKAKSIYEQSLKIIPDAYLQMETKEFIEKCNYIQNNVR